MLTFSSWYWLMCLWESVGNHTTIVYFLLGADVLKSVLQQMQKSKLKLFHLEHDDNVGESKPLQHMMYICNKLPTHSNIGRK